MNAVVEHDAPRLPALQSGGAVRAIVPQDFDGAWRIANAVVKAGMAPKGLDTPEKAMVAIMHGLEVGLTPMAALQSIAVVNGRPTIWGDGALGLVRASAKCEFVQERLEGEGDAMVAICEVKRKGEAKPVIGRFSVADAKKASLWQKQGPWAQYPKRMLAMRARAFALRDGFADVLRGLGIAEEVQDTPMRDITPTPPQPPRPPAPPSAQIAGPAQAKPDAADPAEIVTETGEATDAVTDAHPLDPNAFFEELETSLAAETTAEGVEARWTEFDPLATFEGDDVSQSIADAIKRRRLMQIEKSNAQG